MRLYLMFFLFLLCCGNIFAQENKPASINGKGIEIRSNSRDQGIVKRDNFHQRRDLRTLQMNKMKRNSLQKAKMQNKSMLMQRRNSEKLQAKQRKQMMLQQKKRAMRNKAKR